MNRIGIIGGIGPESTIAYYTLLIKRFKEKLGTKDYPEVLIHSINMTEMLTYAFNGQQDILVKFLESKISVLERSGVDYVALASNTPHLVYDELARTVNVQMISIVEETCKAISEMGIHKVGLFGTKSTMGNGFYQRKGKEFNIEIVVPSNSQQNFIHSKYMDELVYNIIHPETKKTLIEIVNELVKHKKIEGLILGGTELPFVLNQKDFQGLKIIDTTAIHIEAILDKMIN
ncbi:MAG: aspartate/glutamate racemase family protein [Flavobacteriaceae bacterium]